MTSQFDPQDWYKSLHDAVIAESILNRIVSNAELVQLGGPNMRRHLADRQLSQKCERATASRYARSRTSRSLHQRFPMHRLNNTGGHNECDEEGIVGSLRKLPSAVRYPGPDGETYTARTDDDKSFTLTKTDARRWLAAVHTRISLGQWEPPAVVAASKPRRRGAGKGQPSMGFEEYSKRWLQMIRTEPNRSGKMRAVGTVRSYAGKVTGYLVPEFGDTPLKEIDADRIREMTDRLDQDSGTVESEVEVQRNHETGTDRAHDDPASSRPRWRHPRGTERLDPAPGVRPLRRRPRRKRRRHYAGTGRSPVRGSAEPVGNHGAACCVVPTPTGRALGVQRRDIEWHDDGSATLTRRQLNANTGDYTELKSEAGKRSLSVPKLMIRRLKEHFNEYVAPEAKAPVIPSSPRGSVPLSNTRWGVHLG